MPYPTKLQNFLVANPELKSYIVPCGKSIKKTIKIKKPSVKHRLEYKEYRQPKEKIPLKPRIRKPRVRRYDYV